MTAAQEARASRDHLARCPRCRSWRRQAAGSRSRDERCRSCAPARRSARHRPARTGSGRTGTRATRRPWKALAHTAFRLGEGRDRARRASSVRSGGTRRHPPPSSYHAWQGGGVGRRTGRKAPREGARRSTRGRHGFHNLQRMARYTVFVLLWIFIVAFLIVPLHHVRENGDGSGSRSSRGTGPNTTTVRRRRRRHCTPCT